MAHIQGQKHGLGSGRLDDLPEFIISSLTSDFCYASFYITTILPHMEGGNGRLGILITYVFVRYISSPLLHSFELDSKFHCQARVRWYGLLTIIVTLTAWSSM
jgi:hypothetical protein